MSVRHLGYRVVVPGDAPLGCPTQLSKIFGKGQLEAAKQWARERADERGNGAIIHLYSGRSKQTGLPSDCPVWQIHKGKKKETTSHPEMRDRISD